MIIGNRGIVANGVGKIQTNGLRNGKMKILNLYAGIGGNMQTMG